MVSGLGLAALKPLQERKNSPAPAISERPLSSPDKKAEDTSLSNSSSAVENKSLDKKSKTEFDKKLSQYKDKEDDKTKVDAKADTKVDKADSDKETNAEVNSEKTSDTKAATKPETKSDKKASLEAKDVDGTHKDTSKKIVKDGDKKIVPTSNVNVSELSQMQMLNIPNQFNATQATPKMDDTATEASAQSAITKIDQLPAQAQPVARFLQSMYENFGIRPEKVISALNQLPANTLLQSPHDAMTPLFEKLELQPKQFTKAQIMFNEMVTELENVTQPTAAAAMMQAPQMPVDSKISAQKISNPKSTKLNAKGEPVQATPQKPTLDALIEQKWNRKALEPQNYRTQSQPLTPAQAAKLAQTSPQAAQPTSLSEIFHIDPQQVARMQAQNPQESIIAVDKLQDFDPNIKIQEVKLNPNKITDQFFVEGGQDKTLTQLQQMQLKNLSQKEQGQDKEKMKEELKTKLGDQNIIAAQDTKSETQTPTVTTNKMEPVLTPNLTDAKNVNVSQLTESTKSLIAKGGGEMKIQLHPEGLGQLQLKVHVQDGQVGIQMIADNHDAKRLLETGLNDLKLNLAEHKLNVSHLKVDVADQTTNNFMNMEQNMHREEARDFLGQFRDWNESLRQANVGPGSTRGYQSQPKAPNVQQSRGANADGRLYLVA